MLVRSAGSIIEDGVSAETLLCVFDTAKGKSEADTNVETAAYRHVGVSAGYFLLSGEGTGSSIVCEASQFCPACWKTLAVGRWAVRGLVEVDAVRATAEF